MSGLSRPDIWKLETLEVLERPDAWPFRGRARELTRHPGAKIHAAAHRALAAATDYRVSHAGVGELVDGDASVRMAALDAVAGGAASQPDSFSAEIEGVTLSLRRPATDDARSSDGTP